jgi:diaminopimelate epimerase
MKVDFVKYHGTGNDFILIDDRDNHFPQRIEIIRYLCDRRFGIGADGLILLQKRKGYDFEMIYFNSDGKISTMCGNGGRCMIAFADELSLYSGETEFLASDGAHRGLILSKAGSSNIVKLGMREIPGLLKFREDYFIDTGSPHVVRFVENADDLDVIKEGRIIRYHPDFGNEGTNVNFAEIRKNKLYIRSYERGVEDETLSCGTGITAAALAFADRQGVLEGPVNILSKGGSLKVYFKRTGQSFRDIWLEGPAVRVFDGTCEI